MGPVILVVRCMYIFMLAHK